MYIYAKLETKNLYYSYIEPVLEQDIDEITLRYIRSKSIKSKTI